MEAYRNSAHILAPGAFARLALVNRISGLKMPITFVCAYISATS
jgi:hypothetical protein